jgi:hypothetical protein
MGRFGTFSPVGRRTLGAVYDDARIKVDRYVVDETAVAQAILRRSVEDLEQSLAPDLEPGASDERRPDLRDRTSEEPIEAVLELARNAVGADLAMLTEMVEEQEVARRLVGDWPGLELDELEGASVPLQDTFCQRLLEGRIPSVIPDVQGDDRVRDLALARGLGVGAWMGVPLRTSDARLYLLCCLARAASPTLGPADVTKLRRFAVSVGLTLDLAA